MLPACCQRLPEGRRASIFGSPEVNTAGVVRLAAQPCRPVVRDDHDRLVCRLLSQAGRDLLHRLRLALHAVQVAQRFGFARKPATLHARRCQAMQMLSRQASQPGYSFIRSCLHAG